MTDKNIDLLDDFFVTSKETCTPDALISALKSYTELSNQLKIKDPLLFRDFLSGASSQSLFRRSESAKELETFVWLSNIQRLAEIVAAVGGVSYFNGLTNGALKELSELSLDARNLSVVSSHLLRHGIILIYLPQTSGMRTDGVLFRLSSGNPVIGMSLRYNRYDYYWFTLMHELSHVALHFNGMNSPHFDCLEDTDKALMELEADKLAKDTLISRNDWRTASARKSFTEQELLSCAQNLSIHPAILAGMIRYDTGNYKIFSSTVQAIDIRKALLTDE